MTDMKKMMTLVLALALALSLAACGGTGNNAAGNTADNTAGNTANDSANSTANDAADAGDSAAAGDYGDFADALIEPGKLIMVTNASFPPYEMTDDDNNVIGIDPDIAQVIADKLGLELVIDNIDFDAALMAVQEGRADVMLAGMSYNEERDVVMDFSDTYATGYQVIIVREDDDRIAGGNDDLMLVDTDGNVIEDVQIGVQRGTTGELYCQDAYGVDKVTSLDNGSVAVQALLNGQVDCVVIDIGPAEEYVEANPGLKIVEGAYTIEDYCVGVDEGNTALLEAVNKALNEMIDDGTVDEIMNQYIGG